MKKIVLSFIFLLTFSFLSFNSSFAQEELSIKEMAVSPVPEKVNKNIEYNLPYSGLLPDSPLYFLKVMRDAVVDFLIADPLKKAEFYILQADKRMSAGMQLAQKKDKYALAESTISKAENYFDKAISKTNEAKNQGMEIREIKEKMIKASKKHQEIINNIMKEKTTLKEAYANLLKRAKKFEQQAVGINQ